MKLLIFKLISNCLNRFDLLSEVSIGLHQCFDHCDRLNHFVGQRLGVQPVKDVAIRLLHKRLLSFLLALDYLCLWGYWGNWGYWGYRLLHELRDLFGS